MKNDNKSPEISICISSIAQINNCLSTRNDLYLKFTFTKLTLFTLNQNDFLPLEIDVFIITGKIYYYPFILLLLEQTFFLRKEKSITFMSKNIQELIAFHF